MKTQLLFFFILLFPLFVPAQTAITPDTSAADTSVYIVAEEDAEFPGGTEALLAYLHKNIRYPQLANGEILPSMVIVSFIVEKDGSLSGIRFLRESRSAGEQELAAECLRVLRAMPAWKPAKMNGNIVRQEIRLPIRICLKGG